MSPVMTSIVGFSLVGLLILSAIWAKSSGNWRRFAGEAAGILLFGGFLHVLFGFPLPASGTAAKGPSEGLDLHDMLGNVWEWVSDWHQAD